MGWYQDNIQTFKYSLRIILYTVLILFIAGTFFLSYVLLQQAELFDAYVQVEPVKNEPFPVSVFPAEKKIIEQSGIETYLEDYFAQDYRRTKQVAFLDRLYRKIAHLPWYQNLASPKNRILVIFPGERKEEIAHNFSLILGWNDSEKEEFLSLVTEKFEITEGVFYPGTYVTLDNATPAEIAALIKTQFQLHVLNRYTNEVAAQVPLSTTLNIAALIEREAYTFSDMRIVSGVIWNRLFSDMKLQLDASLQYARANNPYEPEWWPVPVPDDKFIDSPFNTYLHYGLPPEPISNPSAAALIAALNPINTDCLFYFHGTDGTLHCSKDYDEHKGRLREVFNLAE